MSPSIRRHLRHPINSIREPLAKAPGSGSAVPSGRLLFLATVAAFLLVPAAQAFAASTVIVEITGTGAGEVSSVGGAPITPGELEGNPPIECSYASPGPQVGTCEDEATYSPEWEAEGVWLTAIAAPGSEFVGWTKSGAFGSFGCTSPQEACAPAGGKNSNQTWLVIATFQAIPHPLTVFVNGQGTVTSNPAGISCSGGEECTEEFAGQVTLTAAPASGWVIAGWIGCRQQANPETCVVNLDEEREVTAVFMQEGEKGEKGDTGNTGPQGPQGEPGTDGTNGTNGKDGATGPAGPQGPQGAQGPAGPAGKVTVTCKVKGKKVKCVVKQATASSSRLRWSLHRAGRTVSHGSTSAVRLQRVLNHLRPGQYTLRLAGQKGATQINVG